jgi:UDP-glucose 4-epimerase
LTYISSYVYGPPQYLPVDESHPIAPASPYNHSKLVAEEVCMYYYKTFGVPVTIFRPVNIYGPGQNADFLIPKIIQQTFDNSITSIEVMDLKPKRDYLYINDFIQAIIASMNSDQFDIFNLGCGYSLSVEDVINTIQVQSGINKAYHAKNEPREHEIWDVYTNITKIKNRLGWVPVTSFAEGIRMCINEFRTRK